MDNNELYLIPANSKKSMLIFGLFNRIDLTIVLVGLGLTLILLLVLPVQNLAIGVLAILPGSIAALLVFPIPNYHNTLTLIKSILSFFFNRRNFQWEGWCLNHGEETKTK